MAEKAGLFCNQNVAALDHLRVAAGAAQLFASSEFPQMVTMIKFYILELDGSRQILGLVTALTCTGCIGYFRPGLGLLVRQRNVLGKLVQAIELALDFPRQSWFEVTVRTADVRV
jgi:hypothetical protein